MTQNMPHNCSGGTNKNNVIMLKLKAFYFYNKVPVEHMKSWGVVVGYIH